MNEIEIFHNLQNNPHIREKDCGNNIHSFNFTREAFWGNHWNEQTITARGLFVDTCDGSVYARSYNKFFNMDERLDTSYNYLKENLSYPVSIFRKENGYLGILSVHDENIQFFSKSTNEGPFAENFMNIVNYDMNIDHCFFEYLDKYNCSAVFEVIDVENDRHFVEYDYNQVILLDIIKNQYEFEALPYEEMKTIAEKYNVPYKVLFDTIESKEEFEVKITELEHIPFIEGYVFVDQNNCMFKLKTCWYRFWKAIRSRGQYIYKHLKLYSHMDVPSHRDLDGKRELYPIIDEAFNYYAFARDAGLECPHVMDVMNFMEKTSLQDLSIVI